MKSQHFTCSVAIHNHICAYLCPCVCVCVCVHVHTSMCTCRMDKDAPERSAGTGTAFKVSHIQHLVLDVHHAYCTVDDMQQQMFVVPGNPGYSASFDHSQQPVQGNDNIYSDPDLSEEQESVTNGILTHGVASRREAASAK